MGSEWPRLVLNELVEEVIDRRGITPLKLDSDFTRVGHRVVSAKTIKGRRVDLSADEPRFVDDLTYRKWMRTPLRADDVLLTSEAPLGEAAYLSHDRDWCVGQRLFAIRTKKDRLEGRFLFYALRDSAVLHDLLSRATGTTAQGIRQSELRLVRVPVPPLSGQHAIAYILGTLDDKIELNRRMSETLEAMARALFKSWFVDFDPVRAKMEGRDPGLPTPLADLFPARLVDSELGEIPEGWEVGTLTSLSALNPEGWTKNSRPAEIEYVDLANTKWGRIDAVTRHASADAPSRAQRILRPGDTIVGTVRPGNGSYALISRAGLTGSTGFAVLRPTFPTCTTFVYLAATSRENLETLAHLADGGAYPAVRPEVVAATPAVVPDSNVLTAFSRATDSLFAAIAQNERESRTLAALRDALLPKLVSGELRVADADKLVASQA